MMDLFYNLINEHEFLLKSRGYGEEALNSPFKVGWLLKELQQNLFKAVNEMLIDNLPTAFTLRTVGFFNNDADIVRFKMHYLFDPSNGCLEIKQLDILLLLEKLERKLHLNSNRELPPAGDALQLVKGQFLVRKRPARQQVGNLGRLRQGK